MRLWIALLLVACTSGDDASAVANVTFEPATRDVPSGRISVASKRALDETTLTPDMMIERVTSMYMAGLKRCYASGLRYEATARGRVTLKFQVTDIGRVESATATGFAKHIDTCIAERMATWVFVVPKDKSGEPTKAAFEIVLQLVPS